VRLKENGSIIARNVRRVRKMTIERAIKLINKNNMLDGSDFSLALEIVLDTIETLQAENEQLKADCDRFKERLQISPYGDDKIDELDEALENYKFQYEQLKQENEQLQAQVARVREALTIANNYMPDIGHFCTCGQCKTCGTAINYAGYKYCLKCARVIIDEALSDTPVDYHNPADVEALRKAREAIKAAWSDGSVNAALEKASEALTAIDKAIGG